MLYQAIVSAKGIVDRCREPALGCQSIVRNKGRDPATRHHLADEVHIGSGGAEDISTPIEIEDGAIARA